MKRFKLGDYVQTVNKSAIEGKGIITNIMRGGKTLGFPWEDDMDHYGFEDERTKVFLIVHPKSLEKVKN